ncbi:MAG: EAL domain-containing protein [Hallerella porci]|uniref:EAL and modified HD-GYP domain-containing signal transduction protein n=1 Tax=Hallerella porci TaxID=1945871 RepID=A0ABX5LJA9_9BACT|nr:MULTISPECIES: EAL domain-containing protein [Hallerella]MCI5600264.1 EAL domain-containing protein [Hallerella sp.]MDY3921242.1 EAL domain-containing protein [Hallerella porci]PWK94771.1 EAL and modified HD-GYP domain-containing signal transduction protein [Hallerella porci]
MNPVESPAYLARQPILDSHQGIFAYELLFRDSPDNRAVIHNGVRETAQVLENVLNNIGLARLVGNHKAFINCSRQMLLDGIFGPLDSDRFVLEILESVSAEKDIVEIVKKYHARGFEFALDDVVFEPENLKRLEEFFPYIKYVKLDLIENSPEALKAAVPYFKERGMMLLAEKVETEEEFKERLSEGYDLFQGFFFAQPEIVRGKRIDGSLAFILHLLQFLRGEPSFTDIEKVFSEQEALSKSLVQYANSQKSYRRRPIETVQDAIAWLGIPQIRDWLMLLLYAQPEMGGRAQGTALFQNVSQRACFVEALAEDIDAEGPLSAQAFITAIISRMDALVKAPMPTILEDLKVDKEITQALLHGSGKLGTLLALAEAVENDRQERVGTLMKRLSLSNENLVKALNAAYGNSHG